MNSIVIAGLVSWLVILFLIRFNHLHARMSSDVVSAGVQKFHAQAVPRIGGAGPVSGMLAVSLWLLYANPSLGRYMLWLLLASIPAFVGGLAEDLTKRVSVLVRLLLTMISALLGYWLLEAGLIRLDIPLLDTALRWWPFSLLLTVVAIAGVANAVNIIDGFNGLAGMVCVMIFGALAYVAYWVGDNLLWSSCAALAGGLFGFLVWNYPRGHIFLGDGGAYFLGFMIGEISVLLVVRNPEVSPWFPLLLVIYPVFETLFSIYRKKILRGMSPSVPDGVHLHMLVYRRLVRWAVGSREAGDRTSRNALTSPYLWVLSSLAIVPAVLFWRSTPVLMFFVCLFALVYLWLYRSIVLFHVPKRFVLRGKPAAGDQTDAG